MTITHSQLREICARRKTCPAKPSVRANLVRAGRCVGRLLFDCFEGPGKTVRPFGVSAGGVI